MKLVINSNYTRTVEISPLTSIEMVEIFERGGDRRKDINSSERKGYIMHRVSIDNSKRNERS